MPTSRIASSCAVVALLATTCFFFLHHVGNLLPYDLAAQRFKAELESNRLDEGNAKGYKGMYEYCELSGIVLAGARQEGQGEAEDGLRDAVILKRLAPTSDTSFFDTLSSREYCDLLEAAVYGAVVPEGTLKTRYWFGGKALYAIALRYASVYQIREFTRIATYAAYFLLAVSLLLLSPKMLLVAAPLVLFGASFAGIDYWADVANGFPYLWTVVFVAALALFARGDVRRRIRPGTVPVCCFAAGTVSVYLGLGDGHTYLAIVWIGMVAWFGYESPRTVERTMRAASCVVFYGAGLVVCYALGQAVKAMFLGEVVWWNFWVGLVGTAEAFEGVAALSAWPAQSIEAHVGKYIDSFFAMAWPSWLPSGVVAMSAAASALAISLGLAVFEARRGRPALLWDVLCIVGLMSIISLMFLSVDGYRYRTSRYVFVPLALCLSTLILAVTTVRWRMAWPTAGKLSAVLLGASFAVCGALSWYLPIEARATARLIDSVAHMKPVVSATFDVYLDGDRLVYVKEECADEDVDARFFLHVEPVDVADLPGHRQHYGFDNLNFSFRKDRLEYVVGEVGLRDSGRCAVERPLPDYPIVAIETGQFVDGQGRQWSGRFSLE